MIEMRWCAAKLSLVIAASVLSASCAVAPQSVAPKTGGNDPSVAPEVRSPVARAAKPLAQAEPNAEDGPVATKKQLSRAEVVALVRKLPEVVRMGDPQTTILESCDGQADDCRWTVRVDASPDGGLRMVFRVAADDGTVWVVKPADFDEEGRPRSGAQQVPYAKWSLWIAAELAAVKRVRELPEVQAFARLILRKFKGKIRRDMKTAKLPHASCVEAADAPQSPELDCDWRIYVGRSRGTDSVLWYAFDVDTRDLRVMVRDLPRGLQFDYPKWQRHVRRRYAGTPEFDSLSPH